MGMAFILVEHTIHISVPPVAIGMVLRINGIPGLPIDDFFRNAV